MFADSKDHNHALSAWVADDAAYRIAVVRRPAGAAGWVTRPQRWTVERTIALLENCRRLSKGRERSVRSAKAFVKRAMIHLMLTRLAPEHAEPAFRYRVAA